MTRPERVLVTGAAGFVGSHLAERFLLDGRQVIGLDNLDPYYDPALKRVNLASLESHPGFRFVEGDIRDPDAYARVFDGDPIDGVVHLAALAGVRPSLETPARYADVNVHGTTCLFESCVRHGVERVVFASSSSIYGERSEGPFHESDPVERPISHYAATKRAGELLGHTFHHAHGLQVVCARIFTAYGPRQRPDLAIRKFATRMLAGQSVPIFGDGKSQRDFTYVSDLVGALRGCLDTELGYAILNVGAGRTVTVLDTVAALERALGIEARIEWLPRQTGDVSKTWADIAAAREAIGYEPEVQLEEGIQRFVAWLREQA